MITIYHNTRCRKSGEALELLENSGKEFQIVEYLKEMLSFEELSSIIDVLKIKPVELIRKNEAIWKEHYKGKELTDEELITIMVENPKLIERPIIVYHDKAIIGRPAENIKKIL
ncbi:MAG: arsenate reductase (glutaredoxin) [Flavobacteriaceae bacterium]|nr:MAG: arsenate reductase (glutaredoxin) [Flavobacteriaceae bacterium]